MDSIDLKNALARHTGSEQIFFHSLVRSVNYTEGVRFFARNASTSKGGGAYWLLDILVTEQTILNQAKEFALITLTVTGSKAKIVVTDGNDGTPPAFERDIAYTDCPEGEWKFYFIDNLILLPSEY